MSNDDIKKYSVHQCCDVKEYLGVNGLKRPLQVIKSSMRDNINNLDLDQTVSNVELVRAIFIYYNMFKFQVD